MSHSITDAIEAFAAGEISAEHVRVAVRSLGRLPRHLLDAEGKIVAPDDPEKWRRTGEGSSWVDSGPGADVVTTEMVVFEWLGSSENAAFREVQKLIK